MKIATVIMIGLVFAGCSNPKTSSTGHGLPVSFRIIKTVNHNGWATCGDITVFAGGEYSYKDYHIWSTPPDSDTWTGNLPSSLYETLLASSDSFPVNEGVHTYELYVDDHHHKRPEGVEDLERYLFEKHTKPFLEPRLGTSPTMR